MPGGEFLAVQPHIWIVPIVFLVSLLLLIGGVITVRISNWDSGWDTAGFITSLISGIVMVTSLVGMIIQMIPFDAKYWNYYTVTGTIDSYTNGLDEGTGQFTGVPIFTLEGSDVRYVSDDSRLAAMQNEEVTMRCQIGWRWYGSDVYTCALGPGANG